MKKSIKLLICILIAIVIIPLNSCVQAVPSKDATLKEITDYVMTLSTEEIKSMTADIVSIEVLNSWLSKIESYDISNPNAALYYQYVKPKIMEIRKAVSENYNFNDIESEADINFWKPGQESNTKLKSIAGRILGIVQVVGSIISVLFLVIMGIKYMFGSVSEKAKYKETMIPYIIGCVMLFATSNIASVIYNVAKNL